jgi:hypothetical protein
MPSYVLALALASALLCVAGASPSKKPHRHGGLHLPHPYSHSHSTVQCNHDLRTCKFSNVCVNSDLTLLLVGEAAPDINLTRRADPHETPVRMASVAPESDRVGIFLTGMWVWAEAYADNNFGHTLGDEVFASWRMMRLWNLDHAAARANVITNRKGKRLMQYGSLLRSVDNVVTVAELRDRYSISSDVDLCFETLLLGNEMFGYAYNGAVKVPNFKEDFAAFREHSMAVLHVRSLPVPHKPTVTLAQEGNKSDHPQRIVNLDAVADALRSRFPDAEVNVVCWEGMPLRNQIALMAKTDVFFSLPGSDLMNVAWMNKNSTMVVVCRAEGSTMCDKPDFNEGNEIRLWFRFTEHKIAYWCEEELFSKAIKCENGHFISSMLSVDINEAVSRVGRALDEMQQHGIVKHSLSATYKLN